MNEIVNNVLLAGDKFLCLKCIQESQACVPFAKNKEWMWRFKETGDSRYIYQNELHNPCFQHEMAYGRRTTSDKILCDKAVNFAKNPKLDGYRRDRASIVYKCFDKKTADGEATLAESGTLATQVCN